MNATGSVTIRGGWPGLVTIRSGWWKAVARPFNDQSTDAVLRMERGSAEFVRRAATALLDLGATQILSPPLMPGSTSTFTRAGFSPHSQLLLMERDLRRDVPELASVHEATDVEEATAIEIDDAAFDSDWRVGRLGLVDARNATPHSIMLWSDVGPGFSVIGIANEVGYLQRIAVHPDHQGAGLGRVLVRGSMAWARRSGARTMLLNTQPGNDRAAALYRSEGFRDLPTRLTILRFTS